MSPTTTRKIQQNQAQELEHELKKCVSGEVRFDDFSKVLYSTDASIYQIEPVGVVVPRSKDDVLATVEVARNNGIAVLPRGGGTSLAGQTVNHAIVIDFSKYMNRLLEFNFEERWARVEPGIVLDVLNRQLLSHKLHYTPDPSTSNRATVGGSIGNNSCGAHSITYGKTIDQVQELQVVLSDGSEANFHSVGTNNLKTKLSCQGLEFNIYREVTRIARENRDEIEARFPNLMRRVSGYNLDNFTEGDPLNLTNMVVGSEGTLCVVTEAKVNLEPTPNMTALSVVHFKDTYEACQATPAILEHRPAAIELIDKMILDQCRSSMGFARNMTFVEGNPGAILLVEFFGQKDELLSRVEALKNCMKKSHLGYACINFTEKAAQANVWAVRKAGLGLLMSVPGNAKPIPFVEDTAVPPEKLAEFVRRFDQIVNDHGTQAGYYGHASVGCLHIRPLIDLKSSEGMDRMFSIASSISDLVLEFDGALSGEHGDGIARSVWTEKMFGSRIYEAFRQVKQAFDPQNIMNPGKIVDSPPMTENLRYTLSYKTTHLKTHLDFSKYGGYTGAVEMCNGMGACRKTDGTMCPSYQVTKEEEHSTRGRANLLGAALSGALPVGSFTSERLYEALDLCLECKGCKGECPSGVDMAKLKYEFLQRYYAANGTPLRAKLFADINRLNRIGCLFAPLSNWVSKLPVTRLLGHSLLGIHKNRPLPPFARPTFPQWFRSYKGNGSGHHGRVVLFNDTFMNYNYPQIGRAAVTVLEKAGFQVEIANVKCCGRPMISKGMLSKAEKYARYNVDRLYDYIEQGIPVVGCEPSCLLTLRDEYPDLLKDKKSRKVAEGSYLIDEFLLNLQNKDQLSLEFSAVQKKVLFHAHCHQKALLGTEVSRKVLSMPPGYKVEVVDSGCCGMAGAFGYEKEHYDISQTIGKERLFPSVSSKGQGWDITVMGISCRQQIEHGTGRYARHLVEVLQDALV